MVYGDENDKNKEVFTPDEQELIMYLKGKGINNMSSFDKWAKLMKSEVEDFTKERMLNKMNKNDYCLDPKHKKGFSFLNCCNIFRSCKCFKCFKCCRNKNNNQNNNEKTIMKIITILRLIIVKQNHYLK